MMQSSKSTKNAASRTVSITLPATVGSVTKTKGKSRRSRQRKQTAVAPVSLGMQAVTGRPQISNSPGADGRIRVRHTEFVANVTGTNPFEVTSYAINPGQAMTFPWLSGLAIGFESYLFNSLSFSYVPSVGTATAGVVNLAIDYDALDPAPLTKAQFMQMHGAVRVVPWDSIKVSADSLDLKKLPQRYTRKSAWNGPGDLKTYDVGNFIVGTSGFGQVIASGELYVTYDVTLMTPQPIIYAPEDYAISVTADPNVATIAKPLGPGTAAAVDVKYDGSTGRFNFERVGKYCLDMQSVVDPQDANTATHEIATSANITVTPGTVFRNVALAAINRYFHLVVDAAPAYLTTQISGVPHTGILPASMGELTPASF